MNREDRALVEIMWLVLGAVVVAACVGLAVAL